MNKLIAAAVLVLTAATGFAVEYKWTGAVSSDFTEAGNWLVKSGDEWVATETPPTNCYGVATVVFDGDASLCPNQPVISTDYTVRDLKFLTSGWTIGGTGSLRLNHCFGGSNYTVDSIKRPNIAIAVTDASTSGTNTIAVAFKTTYGYTYDIGEGATLMITGVCSVDNGPGNNLGSSAKHSRKQGAGTLVIGGVGDKSKLTEKYLEVYDGTVVLGRTSTAGNGVNVITGTLRVVKTGKVVFGASDQVSTSSDPWMLSGKGTIDFANWYQSITAVRIGAESNVETGVDWTGELLNTQNVRIGSGNTNSQGAGGRFSVNPVLSQPMVLASGIDTLNEQESSSDVTGRMKFFIGDSPDLPVEVKVNGMLFPGNTFTYCEVGGLTYGDETTYGAMELNATGNCKRVMLWVSAGLYMNAKESSAISSLVHLEVRETGMLGGSGLVTYYTNNSENNYPKYNREEATNRVIKVYGTLAPGSVDEPDGTLTIQRSEAGKTFATRFYSGSTFKLNVAENGNLPQVNQTDGSVIIEDVDLVRAELEAGNAALGVGVEPVDIDAALEAFTAPTVVVSGEYAPTLGRHRILTVKGTLSGEFAPEVVKDFPNSKRYAAQLVYDEENGFQYVDLKISPVGMSIFFR